MKKDLQIVKALILEMQSGECCKECGGPMYEGMCMECGYPMEEKKQLSTKQKYIAKQAPPEDEINKADFEKLRAKNEGHEGQDHEVSMANNSIDSILWAAQELKKHLGDQERDIPAWIQDHITNAENYIVQAAKNFHDYEDHEEEEYSGDTYDDGLDETSLTEAKKKPSAGLTKKQKSAVAKKARAGKDVGKKGKGFEKIAKKAAKEYGSEERGRKVAAAAMWKNVKRK